MKLSAAVLICVISFALLAVRLTGIYGRENGLGASSPRNPVADLRAPALSADDPILIKKYLHGVSKNEISRSDIEWAASKGKKNYLEALLEHGFPPNGSKDDGAPIYMAVARGSLECVQILLRYGASVHIHPKGWEPCLVRASYLPSREEIAELLLRAGANPNERGSMWVYVDQETKKPVRPKGPTLSVRNVERVASYSGTPLYLAARFGRVMLVRLLLRSGADPSIRGNDGLTPRQIAHKFGHTDVEKLIRSYHKTQT